ncbi:MULTISPECIES: hypothetical protein [Flavobacterium]|uniref:hypothetical protein n=1 Tax=Flavobacterium TaxID=237 RepID=UPI001FCB9499|nr:MULTISPECIES: hypothetical protein [Flavobacterium]UOK42596.1 hypothetical protein LZF87_00310 [Flavobacterium enshiense]
MTVQSISSKIQSYYSRPHAIKQPYKNYLDKSGLYGAGGAGEGAYTASSFVPVTIGTSYTITISTFGSGGNYVPTTYGEDGGATTDILAELQSLMTILIRNSSIKIFIRKIKQLNTIHYLKSASYNFSTAF